MCEKGIQRLEPIWLPKPSPPFKCNRWHLVNHHHFFVCLLNNNELNATNYTIIGQHGKSFYLGTKLHECSFVGKVGLNSILIIDELQLICRIINM
jgi:hypothetical protein